MWHRRTVLGHYSSHGSSPNHGKHLNNKGERQGQQNACIGDRSLADRRGIALNQLGQIVLDHMQSHTKAAHMQFILSNDSHVDEFGVRHAHQFDGHVIMA